MIQKYPLQWPDGWKRTKIRLHGKFNRKSITPDAYGEGSRHVESKRLSNSEAITRVFDELRQLGVKHIQEDVVISTNLRLNMSGLPRGDQGEPADPGVAVYWELKGVRQCIAIDQYFRVADNLAAVAATLAAMRAIERHGGAEVLERAFTGFAALPERTERHWREVMGFGRDQFISLEGMESKYREIARKFHPDVQGGSVAAMQELNQARDQARKELAPSANAEALRL